MGKITFSIIILFLVPSIGYSASADFFEIIPIAESDNSSIVSLEDWLNNGFALNKQQGSGEGIYAAFDAELPSENSSTQAEIDAASHSYSDSFEKGKTYLEKNEIINSKVDYENPIVRNAALKLSSNFPGQYNVEQIIMIYEYVMHNWNYVSDPNEGYYSSASNTLQLGIAEGKFATGDCDDYAILIASFIEAIGGTSRIILGYSDTSGHAYAEAYLGENDSLNTKTIINWLNEEYSPDKICLDIDPSTNDVWLNLDWFADYPGGVIYDAKEEDVIPIFEKTNHTFEKIAPLTANTNSSLRSRSWHNTGIMLIESGDYENALIFLKKATGIDKNNDLSWFFKGVAEYSTGKLNDAIESYIKATDINPNFTEAWNNMAVAYFYLGKYYDSNKACNKALNIEPLYMDSLATNGAALLKLDKYNEAIECYESYLKNRPTDGLVWISLGMVYHQKGDYEEAINCYKEAIYFLDRPESKQDTAFALQYMAQSLEKLNRFSEANEAIVKAKELSSDNAGLSDLLRRSQIRRALRAD
jgi:tetratricopeptide (TPR) repeat protein